jgi:hypothetical protein
MRTLDICRVDAKTVHVCVFMNMVYKAFFTCNADILISEHWLVSSPSFSLLHLAEIISNLELGSCLFLHLLDSHARCNLSQSETTVLTVNLEDTLSHSLAKIRRQKDQENSPNR